MLYGERPFAGESWEELAGAVTGGVIRPPRAGTEVPARIRRALVRGLAGVPDARFATMEELVEELAWIPIRRRRLALAVAAVVVLAAGVIMVAPDRAPLPWLPSC